MFRLHTRKLNPSTRVTHRRVTTPATAKKGSVVLYVTKTMDGMIARKDGTVDWIPKATQEGEDFGFEKFLSTIDTIAMGR